MQLWFSKTTPTATPALDQSRTHTMTHYTGLSENSVPLNPMVNDHCPYISLLNGYNWEYTLFSDKPICLCQGWNGGGATVAKDEASLLARSATEQPEQPSQSHLALAGAGQEAQADPALGG